MTLREIELQQQLDRRDEFIKSLERKFNEIDVSIEYLSGEINEAKRKVRNADFSLGTVYADVHYWTGQIFKWREEIDGLSCLKSNMNLNK